MPEHRGRIESIRLIGGSACLDFVNTANGRRTNGSLGSFEENLCSPNDVATWAARANLTTPEEQANLLRAIASDPASAHTRLTELIAFRDRLYRLFEATVDGRACADGTAELNRMLTHTLPYRHIEEAGDGVPFQWNWVQAVTAENLFDRILGPVALCAAELLTGELGRLRLCASDDCDWMFLDTSKSGRRRWCQMDVCGNRAKARRHARAAGL
ncbi:hypothetical protein BTH42_33960 [Burkholderia sp. SRS-W-2-2016]|uniref:CGNR zinc finger domain-containing protein n=1 Tax=Burkholderia sp. SRS-W-2-2016 TaxID=1926878 RepID=UPI00094B1BEE|nr:ABATE domain-containing protein [Burkholderia sp. SRS-W-2-2016]OLL27215.1 hypothetical protein BTH42_33960 [Burkholderia sp. SRS-W-2-2016]